MFLIVGHELICVHSYDVNSVGMVLSGDELTPHGQDQTLLCVMAALLSVFPLSTSTEKRFLKALQRWRNRDALHDAVQTPGCQRCPWSLVPSRISGCWTRVGPSTSPIPGIFATTVLLFLNIFINLRTSVPLARSSEPPSRSYGPHADHTQ